MPSDDGIRFCAGTPGPVSALFPRPKLDLNAPPCPVERPECFGSKLLAFQIGKRQVPSIPQQRFGNRRASVFLRLLAAFLASLRGHFAIRPHRDQTTKFLFDSGPYLQVDHPGAGGAQVSLDGFPRLGFDTEDERHPAEPIHPKSFHFSKLRQTKVAHVAHHQIAAPNLGDHRPTDGFVLFGGGPDVMGYHLAGKHVVSQIDLDTSRRAMVIAVGGKVIRVVRRAKRGASYRVKVPLLSNLTSSN